MAESVLAVARDARESLEEACEIAHRLAPERRRPARTLRSFIATSSREAAQAANRLATGDPVVKTVDGWRIVERFRHVVWDGEQYVVYTERDYPAEIRYYTDRLRELKDLGKNTEELEAYLDQLRTLAG